MPSRGRPVAASGCSAETLVNAAPSAAAAPWPELCPGGGQQPHAAANLTFRQLRPSQLVAVLVDLSPSTSSSPALALPVAAASGPAGAASAATTYAAVPQPATAPAASPLPHFVQRMRLVPPFRLPVHCDSWDAAARHGWASVSGRHSDVSATCDDVLISSAAKLVVTAGCAAEDAVAPAPGMARTACMSSAGFAPGYKDANQDACFAVLGLGLQQGDRLLGVLDGHGSEGHRVSRLLSRLLPHMIHSRLAIGRAPVRALSEAFTQADQVLAASAADSVHSGSTAVVVHLAAGGAMTAAWVGDSRAVLGWRQPQGGLSGTVAGGGSSSSSSSSSSRSSSSSSGSSSSSSSSGTARSGGATSSCAWRALDLTRDHKPELPSERARVERAGGLVGRTAGALGRPTGPFRVWLKGRDYPGLAMTRAFGDHCGRSAGIIAVPEVAVSQLGISRRDAFLLLASDGLWDFVSSEEAVMLAGQAMAGGATTADACTGLIKVAHERWRTKYQGQYIDDITAVLMRFDETAGVAAMAGGES